MNGVKRPVGFWVIVVFLIYNLVFFLVGQTASLFDYDFTVRIGLQESVEAISEYGVQVNRSFGLADTVVAVPLILLSLFGLFLRKLWALTTLAALMGVSLYWPVSCSGLLIFLQGVPGYHLVPPPGYWLIFGLHIGFALWVLCYIIFRGQKLQ
jgi:hypothetical protein